MKFQAFGFRQELLERVWVLACLLGSGTFDCGLWLVAEVVDLFLWTMGHGWGMRVHGWRRISNDARMKLFGRG